MKSLFSAPRAAARFPIGRRLAPGLVAPGLVLAAGLLLAGCAGAPKPQTAMEGPAPEAAPTAEVAAEAAPAVPIEAAPVPAAPPAPAHAPDYGVRVEGIRLTSAGYMLDFRFRVLDSSKAAPLFERATKPYLIEESSGARFAVPNPPKTGPLRTSDPPQEGRVYWMFFANPAMYVQRGSLVTVVIGDRRFEHMQVE